MPVRGLLSILLAGIMGLLVTTSIGCSFVNRGPIWLGLVPGREALGQEALSVGKDPFPLFPASGGSIREKACSARRVPGPECRQTFGDVRGIELYFVGQRGERRGVARVTDPGLVGALYRYLSGCKPADPPDRWPWERYEIVLGRGGTDPRSRLGPSPRGWPGLSPDGGSVYEYLFKFALPHEPGFIRVGQKWYEVPGKFNELLWSLTEYRNATTAISKRDADFLGSYGWTILFKINGFSVTLPREWKHRAGEYPEMLYWAYNNELNRDIGLDLMPFAGQEVMVDLYKVEEPFPEFMHPRREAARAVVVKKDGEIIGAWLDAGRHYGFACSLRGRRFEEVTGSTWDRWIAAFIDYDDPIERKVTEASNSGPESLIRLYYDAVDRGDFLLAHACETRRRLVSYLFLSMNNNFLYNPSYGVNEKYGLGNIARARLISADVGEPKAGYPPGSLLCTVVVDLNVKRPVTYDSGRQTRFIIVRKETERTGWRIESIGTGP